MVVIKVSELAGPGKPLYFKKTALPQGAWIRVGSTDQRCTEEDLEIFYGERDYYDRKPVDYTSLADVDENALARYRSLREKARSAAGELEYSDEELLTALNCMAPDGTGRLTVAGVLMFDGNMLLRRVFPGQRVDYIRVPGNRWMEDPNNRFSSIDMRGPLILLAFRAIDAIYADLPQGFKLESGSIQAESVGLPVQALREAVVNALMHRNYRISSPIQLIRYDNRLEIVNAGFSLKPENELGEPGSFLRNPAIADIFHDTNLAETKGTGIRAMRRLLRDAKMAPPTFESSRQKNQFTARLLLHHFLSKEDLVWLQRFDRYELNDAQKQALIFVREVEAIDNSTYRQLADCEAGQAGIDLRKLRKDGLIEAKGQTRATYYVASKNMLEDGEHSFGALSNKLLEKNGLEASHTSPMYDGEDDKASHISPMYNGEDDKASHISPMYNGEDDKASHISPMYNGEDDKASHINPMYDGYLFEKPKDKKELLKQLSSETRGRVLALSPRVTDRMEMVGLLLDVCAEGAWSTDQLATLTERNRASLQNNYIMPLLEEGKLERTIPDMKKHPKQAYRTVIE